MKKLALDLGTVRIGIASSDALGLLASPYENYNCKGYEKDIEHISVIAKQLSVDEIVVGLPYNMDGTEGKMAEYVRKFCDDLRPHVNCPITLRDERLTSCEAEEILISRNYSREKRKKMLDALSATIILQSYIDEIKSGDRLWILKEIQ